MKLEAIKEKCEICGKWVYRIMKDKGWTAWVCEKCYDKWKGNGEKCSKRER